MPRERKRESTISGFETNPSLRRYAQKWAYPDCD